MGYFGRIIEVGYYDIAQQITRIEITLNSTLTNIMIPRVTKLFSENKIEEIKKIITKSLIFSLSLSFPIIFGLLAIKNEIIIIFFGDEYIAVSQILTFILPIIFIVPIGNVLGIQLMIPLKKEKIVTIIPVIGLLISIVLNFVLIPKIGIKGSIIASLSVESMGSFLSWYFTKHWIDIVCILKKSIKSLIAAILMYIILSNVEVFTKEYLFFKIILGILLYE